MNSLNWLMLRPSSYLWGPDTVSKVLMLALTKGLMLTLTNSLPRSWPKLLGQMFSSSLASCQPLAILRFCDAVVPHRVCLRRLTCWRTVTAILRFCDAVVPHTVCLRMLTCWRKVMIIPPSKGQWLRVGISQPVSDLRFSVAICSKNLGVTSVTFLNGSPPWHIYKINFYWFKIEEQHY